MTTKKCIITILIFFKMSNLLSQSFNISVIDSDLCSIGYEDQQIRKRFIEAIQKHSLEIHSIKLEMDSIDTYNQMYISNILDKFGWVDSLTEDANIAIFLVIDHANYSFSVKYLDLVKKKAEQGIILKSDAATLEDRILMKSLRLQKYGTQTINKGDNVIYVWPIENNEKVDELRDSVGLPLMNSYLQLIENQYKTKVVWDKKLKVEDLKVKFQ